MVLCIILYRPGLILPHTMVLLVGIIYLRYTLNTHTHFQNLFEIYLEYLWKYFWNRNSIIEWVHFLIKMMPVDKHHCDAITHGLNRILRCVYWAIS